MQTCTDQLRPGKPIKFQRLRKLKRMPGNMNMKPRLAEGGKLLTKTPIFMYDVVVKQHLSVAPSASRKFDVSASASSSPVNIFRLDLKKPCAMGKLTVRTYSRVSELLWTSSLRQHNQLTAQSKSIRLNCPQMHQLFLTAGRKDTPFLKNY